MKFYNRDLELQQLNRQREIAFANHSQMTVVTGRRRIGKTKLVAKSCEDSPVVYWFIRRSTEASICARLSEQLASQLGVFVPEGVTSFVQLFELAMTYGKQMKFNLFIDEIQEFYRINPEVFSGLQEIWDRYKDISNVNLIFSGSVYTLMHKIFMQSDQPLYGRLNLFIKLKPFPTAILKEIMHDHNPSYTNDDLLALYAFTGGVPKYVETLADHGALTVDSIIDCIFSENSIFLTETDAILLQEFGKDYGTYYSILLAIATGHTTLRQIEEFVGASVGGLLDRLEADYEVIAKKRPVMAKPKSQTVRYELVDNFLIAAFRYLVKNQDLIQNDAFSLLRELVRKDYTTFTGMVLERYFRQQLRETGRYREVGSWWNAGRGLPDDPSEIDIVALEGVADKVALVAEVKRQKRNFDYKAFMQKVDALRLKALPAFSLKTACLTLDDM